MLHMDNIPTSLLTIYNEKATIVDSDCQLSFRHSSVKKHFITKKAPKLGTFYYKSTFFSNKGLTGLLS